MNGLEAVRGSDYVYLEHYTAILGVDTESLEKFYGKPVIIADREMVESDADAIVNRAKDNSVAMLVVGDPFWYVRERTNFWIGSFEIDSKRSNFGSAPWNSIRFNIAL